MHWEYDERGGIIPESIEISLAEIYRRKWHGKHSDRIPLLLRPVVKRKLDEVERMRAAVELAERRPADAPRRTDAEVRELLQRTDAVRLSRMREKNRG
jgi:hypothetical protein